MTKNGRQTLQTYDLDKTQEWLNRTLAIGKEPPIRGGVKPDRRARRSTWISLGATVLVLIGGIWLGTLLRGGAASPADYRAKAEGNASSASAEGIAPAPPARSPYVPASVRSTVVARPAPYQLPLDAFDLSTPNFDGNLRPLPGHAAPAAPTFLDGPSGTGVFR